MATSESRQTRGSWIMKAQAARRRLNAFCTSHGVRFPGAGVDGPIECPIGRHVLGDSYPNSANSFWELCSGCETVWPLGSRLSTECPNCRKPITGRDLCTECSVFTLTADTVSPLVCSGCGAVSATQQLHHCEEIGDFHSGREDCPCCEATIVTQVRPVEVLAAAARTPTESAEKARSIGGGKRTLEQQAPRPDDIVVEPSAPRTPRRFPVSLVVGVAAAIVIAAIFLSRNAFSAKI